MTRYRFLAVLLALVAALVACTTPPITTPAVTSTVYLRDIVPGMPESRTPVLVPAAGPFTLPASGIDVPQNARQLTLTGATLHMDIENQMEIPLGLQIFLSGNKEALYEEANKLGEVSLEPKQSGRIDNQVRDPAIFKGEKVWVGIKFSTSGSGGQLVAVQGSDAIVVHTSATVQVRLF